jgi:hypothetical protein
VPAAALSQEGRASAVVLPGWLRIICAYPEEHEVEESYIRARRELKES